MKKISSTGRLALSRTTLRQLTHQELRLVITAGETVKCGAQGAITDRCGVITVTDTPTCGTCAPIGSNLCGSGH